MDAVTVLTLLALGGVVGVVAALLGVGGGILMVPALDELLRARGVVAESSQRIAVATSLLTMVPTSLAAGYRQHRVGNVSPSALWMLAPGAVAGAVAGAYFGQDLRAVVLRAIFTGALVLVGLKMLLGKKDAPVARTTEPSKAPLLGLGAFTGVFSALTGLGGGVLMVPGMKALGVGMHRAVGTSSAVIGFMALGAAVTYLLQPVDPGGGGVWLVGTAAPVLAACVAASAFFSTTLGVKLAVGLNADRLRQVFGVSLLVIAVRVIWVMAHG